jgi:hypothetical protein
MHLLHFATQYHFNSLGDVKAVQAKYKDAFKVFYT